MASTYPDKSTGHAVSSSYLIVQRPLTKWNRLSFLKRFLALNDIRVSRFLSTPLTAPFHLPTLVPCSQSDLKCRSTLSAQFRVLYLFWVSEMVLTLCQNHLNICQNTECWVSLSEFLIW